MAMSSPNRKAGRNRAQPMSEINVTPLVDVMLVLLIIFMVAAPLLTVGVEVDLPETDAKPISEAIEPLAVTIKADGAIFVQDTEVLYDALVPHLEAIAEAGYDQRIYIRGEKTALYDSIAKVTGRINAAGYKNLSLVHE